MIDAQEEGQGEGVETPPEGVMLIDAEVVGERAPESVANKVVVTNGEGEPLGAPTVEVGQRDEEAVGFGVREVLMDTV